jgi:hypothetical protein
MARAMTPRRPMASAMRGTTLSAGSNPSRVSRFFTSSTARQHALAAHLADIGVLAHGLRHGPRQVGADIARIRHEAEAVDELQVRHPRRRADGVGGVGPAMAEGPVLVGARSSTSQTFSDTMLPDSGA